MQRQNAMNWPKKHKNYTCKEPGMTIMLDYPYISATPDLEINCLCHGRGLVGIKCPASINNQIPNPKNYHHIEEIDGELSLKKNSEYYYQIQGQMAVTNCSFCDFFVFTFQGYVTCRVNYNKHFWGEVIDSLIWFWKKFIAPELLFRGYKKNMNRVCNENEIIHIQKPNMEFKIQSNTNQEITSELLEGLEYDIIKNI